MVGTIYAYQTYTSIQQQQLAQQQGQIVVKQINDKLDSLHSLSQEQLNAQGNLSNNQRQTLIKELQDLPGVQLNTQHLLKEVLGNETHETK